MRKHLIQLFSEGRGFSHAISCSLIPYSERALTREEIPPQTTMAAQHQAAILLPIIPSYRADTTKTGFTLAICGAPESGSAVSSMMTCPTAGICNPMCRAS